MDRNLSAVHLLPTPYSMTPEPPNPSTSSKRKRVSCGRLPRSLYRRTVSAFTLSFSLALLRRPQVFHLRIRIPTEIGNSSRTSSIKTSIKPNPSLPHYVTPLLPFLFAASAEFGRMLTGIMPDDGDRVGLASSRHVSRALPVTRGGSCSSASVRRGLLVRSEKATANIERPGSISVNGPLNVVSSLSLTHFEKIMKFCSFVSDV
ncbi:hypothetical protein KSP40_PGU017795 [Platanthera guangdongensis]|uniref:Uncharacterized protein n=1 Tax=Platanthera guangdongensis TaxID=2320717 RepID=A0ABR2MED2_9ASPA